MRDSLNLYCSMVSGAWYVFGDGSAVVIVWYSYLEDLELMFGVLNWGFLDVEFRFCCDVI